MDTGLRKSVSIAYAGSGQNDVEYARSIARKMFEMYDKDRSTVLENYEITPMMQDAYRSMNKSFTPTKLDIDSYAKVMDRNGDGRVTLADLEALVIRYLCGESSVSQNTSSYRPQEETVKRSAAPGSYLNGGYTGGDYGGDVYRTSEYTRVTEVRTYDLGPNSYSRGETEKRSSAPLGGDSMARSAIYIQSGKLDQIRRVFDKFDEDRNGFIDEAELKKLMEETYRILGVNRTITNEDVHSYLLMVDSNKDGRVSYPEYETIVTKALARINVKFE